MPIFVNSPAKMAVIVVGALAQDDVKRILSFHIVSQVGYMVMGLGLFTVAGVAATAFFLVHHMPVKTVLFLVGGLIEDETGTSDLDRIGSLASRRPAVALLFALPALSLSGLPPFSGFIAKLALVDAGLAAASTPIVVVSLAVSVLTLLSMAKIWLGVFWGSPIDESSRVVVAVREAGAGPAGRRLMMAATGVAVLGTLLIATFAGPLWDMSYRAATNLVDPSAYIAEVLS